jgi:hypothetical protein
MTQNGLKHLFCNNSRFLIRLTEFVQPNLFLLQIEFERCNFENKSKLANEFVVRHRKKKFHCYLKILKTKVKAA